MRQWTMYGASNRFVTACSVLSPGEVLVDLSAAEREVLGIPSGAKIYQRVIDDPYIGRRVEIAARRDGETDVDSWGNEGPWLLDGSPSDTFLGQRMAAVSDWPG